MPKPPIERDGDSGLVAIICLIIIVCLLFGPQVIEALK